MYVLLFFITMLSLFILFFPFLSILPAPSISMILPQHRLRICRGRVGSFKFGRSRFCPKFGNKNKMDSCQNARPPRHMTHNTYLHICKAKDTQTALPHIKQQQPMMSNTTKNLINLTFPTKNTHMYTSYIYIYIYIYIDR